MLLLVNQTFEMLPLLIEVWKLSKKFSKELPHTYTVTCQNSRKASSGPYVEPRNP